eukprot:snap_masked-scaffold_71-processed-gene-0.7-mRNA-1 protein AED:0.43 eAED:0.43 QI:0/-1/0/1/-1/1/1/0/176
MYLYHLVKSRVAEAKLRFKEMNIHRGVMQGDSLSPTLLILALNSIIERVRKDILENISLNGQNMQLMAFANEVVAFYKRPEQVQDLIFPRRRIDAASSLRINRKKTRVMKIERSIEVSGGPEESQLTKYSINSTVNAAPDTPIRIYLFRVIEGPGSAIEQCIDPKLEQLLHFMINK